MFDTRSFWRAQYAFIFPEHSKTKFRTETFLREKFKRIMRTKVLGWVTQMCQLLPLVKGLLNDHFVRVADIHIFLKWLLFNP